MHIFNVNFDSLHVLLLMFLSLNTKFIQTKWQLLINDVCTKSTTVYSKGLFKNSENEGAFFVNVKS